MFTFIRGLVRCTGGKHERSADHLHKVGEDYFSQCRFCRTKMRRLSKRNWVADAAA